MKKYGLFIFIILFSALNAYCFDIGCFSDAQMTSGVLSVNGDYSFSDFSLSATLNLNLSNNNYGLESLVISDLEYDDGKLGVMYAPIKGATFGYGLLVRDFDTTKYQPPFLKNEQCGLRMDYDFGDFTLEGMGTYSHLYGFQIKDIDILNMNIGLECLSDSTQISSESFGRSAYGAYIEIPLSDEISLFGESASVSNGGEGNLAGVSFDYDLIFAYSKISVASVSFNDRFVPGYFTSGYDLDPVDFSSLEANGKRRDGTMITLNSGVLGIFAFGLTNENYRDGGHATSGDCLITITDKVNITGYVNELSFSDFRPIKGADSNMEGGSIEYKIVQGISASLNYKKTIGGEDTKPYDATFVKVSLNI